MKYIRKFLDIVFIIAALFILFIMVNELWIGGSRHGGMILGFVIYGYLMIATPYLIGRIVSKK